MPRGLVLFPGSERCLLLHPDSPLPQAILEIRLRGCGLSEHGPALWTVPGSPQFYEVHGRSSFLSKTDGNPNSQLPWRLARSRPSKRWSWFWVNFSKSTLSPRQQISFLGTVFTSVQMRVAVTQKRALAIQRLAASFVTGASHTLKPFQWMLGLIAYASPVLQLGLHRMRPLQRWLNPRVTSDAWCLRIKVNRACVTALGPWKCHQWMEQGIPLIMVCRKWSQQSRQMLPTQVGEVCAKADRPVVEREGSIHINCLELLAVCRALHAFLPDLKGHHFLVR